MSIRFLLLFLVLPLFASAQPGRVALIAPHIKTLQLKVDGDVARLPVISLGDNGERLEVSFDDLTHEYVRYTYRIEHCNPDGTLTDGLFASDYVSAMADEEVIEDYANSVNTSVLYTHYKFSLPNAHVRPLLSGNYLLTVSTEDEEGVQKPVVKVYFGVVDSKIGIQTACTTNTDVDWNKSHQQVEMRLDCSSLVLRDAADEVCTIVMQNRRYDNAVFHLQPTAQNGGILIWEHAPQLIFDAGNEYRKFEMLSTRYPGMHGESMRWFDPYYHYELMSDVPRKNYLYDEDQDGLRIVRCENSADPDTEADYAYVHFNLTSLPYEGRKYYVNGRWADTGLSPQYEMSYNEQTGAYETVQLLKMGYYNYLYLSRERGGSAQGRTAAAEGDFFQTENEYAVLAYYKPSGSRYWQLVGTATPVFRVAK